MQHLHTTNRARVRRLQPWCALRGPVAVRPHLERFVAQGANSIDRSIARAIDDVVAQDLGRSIARSTT